MEQNETMTISEFKATCLSVIDRVKRTGQPVIITRHGEPVAMIDPPPAPENKKSWTGSFKSTGKIKGDIISPSGNIKNWDALNE